MCDLVDDFPDPLLCLSWHSEEPSTSERALKIVIPQSANPVTSLL